MSRLGSALPFVVPWLLVVWMLSHDHQAWQASELYLYDHNWTVNDISGTHVSENFPPLPNEEVWKGA
jgi:hypothetical protein